MDESYIRLPFNRPTTASSIPEEAEVNGPLLASRSTRGKQTSYESVIAFDLAPTTQSPPEDSQQSTTDADLRPMVDVYKGLTLADLTDPLPGRAPDYPMHVLMQVAIQSSPLGKLRQCEIRDALIKRFPYFATAGKTWRNTLRHALTNRLSFYKVPKPPSVPGRGAYWSYRFTREPKRKSRPSSSRSNGGGKPGRLRGHSKRGSTFDEDDYEDDDEDDDDEGDEAEAGTVAMTDAPLTTPPLPEMNDTVSECLSRPSTSSQALYQPLSLDASIAAMNSQSFREQHQQRRQSSTASTHPFSQPTSTNAAFDIPQVLSPPQITTSQHSQQQAQQPALSSAPSASIPTSTASHSIQQQQQFAHQHRPTTTSSLDVPLGILSISSPNQHQSQLSSNTATTPGFEQDYSYLVPPPNSASSLASVLSGQSSVNGYASTTTPGPADENNTWLFPENNLFSSFSDDGMFAFTLPMDNTTDPTSNFYYTAPPQSANSMNPPRCNWSSDSNLSATVFSESVSAVSPPQSRIGSSYGAPGPLPTHSRPVTSHEPSPGALLSPGLDLRPTSAGSLYGVTLPRPATASFSSAGKDLWSASLHHPLQQSHTAHQQQHQQQLHVQQPQMQPQPHSAIEPIMHSNPQEGSLSMWNAMRAGFVGGGFDNGGVQLTGPPGIDAFAHGRKWSV